MKSHTTAHSYMQGGVNHITLVLDKTLVNVITHENQSSMFHMEQFKVDTLDNSLFIYYS